MVMVTLKFTELSPSLTSCASAGTVNGKSSMMFPSLSGGLTLQNLAEMTSQESSETFCPMRISLGVRTACACHLFLTAAPELKAEEGKRLLIADTPWRLFSKLIQVMHRALKWEGHATCSVHATSWTQPAPSVKEAALHRCPCQTLCLEELQAYAVWCHALFSLGLNFPPNAMNCPQELDGLNFEHHVKVRPFFAKPGLGI